MISPEYQNFIDNFCPYPCSECGGQVKLKYGPGRTAVYRRGCPPLAYPDDFPTMVCEACGEGYTGGFEGQDEEQYQVITAVYLNWQVTHFAELLRQINDSEENVARALGASKREFRHYLLGSGLASFTLTKLFEILARNPVEYRALIAQYED
jgi:hypothetical protein